MVKTRVNIDQWHKTQCPYCGVGCGLKVGVQGGKVVKVLGNESHPSTQGLLCKKPIFLPDSLRSDDRLLFPQVRSHQAADFMRASWGSALDTVADKIKQVIEDHGPDAIGFYGSGQFTTETYYTLNKLAKGYIGTNNFDANSRLCMASAVAGYVSALGSDGPPPTYADIDEADCFFLIGTNTAACHPVVFNKIKARKKSHKPTTIIVVDPRRTATARVADIHLPINPGTDVPLLNAMLHVMLVDGLIDEDFIATHTNGFEAVRDAALATTPDMVAEICGISAESICAAARVFAAANGTLSFWSMGVNQSRNGVAKNHGIINLHLATGKIGTPGNGPFSLTGQPNAMGGRETGSLSHILPGYRAIKNPQHRQEVADYWGISAETIQPTPGLAAVDMFQAAADGHIKVLWIACTNPMVSMPNLDVVEAALRRAELVIVQDAYHPTDTTRFAHVLLPAAQFSECEGVMTNSERRITYLPKMVDAPGEALPDWEIFTRFAHRMGYGEAFDYASAADPFAEFVGLTQGRVCDYSNLTHEVLKTQGPQQWPTAGPTSAVVDNQPKRLYPDGIFPKPDGRAVFHATPYLPPEEQPNEAYPLLLNTGRLADQWHTMTRTGKSRQLMRAHPEPFVEIHPDDADAFNVGDGDMVQVRTKRGAAVAKALITAETLPGTIFMPFHWGRLKDYSQAVNNLTSDVVDPVSLEPELKACAALITPVWDTASGSTVALRHEKWIGEAVSAD